MLRFEQLENRENPTGPVLMDPFDPLGPGPVGSQPPVQTPPLPPPPVTPPPAPTAPPDPSYWGPDLVNPLGTGNP